MYDRMWILSFIRAKRISDLFFTDQCWQGQGGGQRSGVVTAASVTMWFFCVLLSYTVTTPTRVDLRQQLFLPRHTHAGKAKDWPRGASDLLHFIVSERLNVSKGVFCHITQR